MLRGLDYLCSAGVEPDDRCAEAIRLVVQKRGVDGRWLLENSHPGELHFDLDEGEGTPSRWITLPRLARARLVRERTSRVGGTRADRVRDVTLRCALGGCALVGQSERMDAASGFTSAWARLPEPWRQCFQLGWQSHRAGSVAIGAVVVDPAGTVVATGRNRVTEGDPPAGSWPERISRMPTSMRSSALLRAGTSTGRAALAQLGPGL